MPTIRDSCQYYQRYNLFFSKINVNLRVLCNVMVLNRLFVRKNPPGLSNQSAVAGRGFILKVVNSGSQLPQLASRKLPSAG